MAEETDPGPEDQDDLLNPEFGDLELPDPDEDDNDDSGNDDNNSDDDSDSDDDEKDKKDDDSNDEDDDDEDEEEDDEKNAYDKLSKEVKEAHPELEGIVKREAEFSQVFENAEQAQAAKDSAAEFNQLSRELVESKSLKGMLGAMHKNAPEIVTQIVDTFLNDLGAVDQSLPKRIVEPLIKNTLAQVFEDGKSNGNKNLRIAAQLVNQRIFGNTSPSRHVPEAPRRDEDRERNEQERNRVIQEQQRFVWDRTQTENNNIQEAVTGVMEKKIDKMLGQVEGLSRLEKRALKREIIEEVGSSLGKDSSYRDDVSRGWRNAAQKRFDSGSLTEMKSLIKGRALRILPRVAKKIIKDSTGEEFIKKGPERRQLSGGRQASRGSGLPKAEGMSDRDWMDKALG